MVIRPESFAEKANTVPWAVPESEGLLPVFEEGLTEKQKRHLAAKHNQREEYILRAEKVEDLLRTQLVKWIDDDYICDLRDDITDYDEYSLHQLYDHLFKQFGQLGIKERKKTMEKFHREPDWTRHINSYFARQQACQREMKTTKLPITEATMVDQLVTHFAESGQIPKSRQKWERHIAATPTDDNWTYAKEWHRQELKTIKEANEDAGMDTGMAF